MNPSLSDAVASLARSLGLPLLRRDVRWTGSRLVDSTGRTHPACVRWDRWQGGVRVYLWGPGVLEVVAQGPEPEVIRAIA